MLRHPQPRTSLSKFTRRQAPGPRNAGFTLVELLLVMAVLGVIAAVAWPNILRLSRQQTLLDASDKVRSVASSARVHAIESGLVYQFRYEPGGHHFLVVPFEREVEGVNPNSRGAGIAAGFGRFSKASGTLPSSITFAAPSMLGNLGSSTPSTAAMGSGQQINSTSLAGLPDAGKLGSVMWSGPILFHPNGSATDAMVDLIDRQNQHITLRIRGVTGGVSLSRLHTQDRK